MEEYQEIIAGAASGQVALWNSSMPKDKWKLIKSFCDQSAGTFVLAPVKLRNSEGTDTLQFGDLFLDLIIIIWMFVQAKKHHIYKANIEPAQSAQIASLEGIWRYTYILLEAICVDHNSHASRTRTVGSSTGGALQSLGLGDLRGVRNSRNRRKVTRVFTEEKHPKVLTDVTQSGQGRNLSPSPPSISSIFSLQQSATTCCHL